MVAAIYGRKSAAQTGADVQPAAPAHQDGAIVVTSTSPMVPTIIAF